MDELVSMNIAVDMNAPAGAAWYAKMQRSYWYPTPYVDFSEGIIERAPVRYTSVHPFGRTEAYKTFVGVDNREVTLRLYYAAGESGKSSSTDPAQVIMETVVQPALWLENLKYPTDTQPPPPVFLVIGRLLAMRAIVTACQIDWTVPYHITAPPHTANPTSAASDFLPHAANVTLTFMSVSSNPSGAQQPVDLGLYNALPRPGGKNAN